MPTFTTNSKESNEKGMDSGKHKWGKKSSSSEGKRDLLNIYQGRGRGAAERGREGGNMGWVRGKKKGAFLSGKERGKGVLKFLLGGAGGARELCSCVRKKKESVVRK